MRTLATVATGLLLIAACGGRTPTVPSPPAPTPPVQGSSGFVNLSPGTPILVPALIEDTVRATDEVCFRNWDARGRCRFFTVRAPANGRLTLRLRWAGGAEEMDIFHIVNGLATWAEGGGLVLNMTANEDLVVFVMSYAAPQNFTLETSLQP
jgi:hypothetical protein